MPFFDGANLGDPEAQSALGYLSSLAGSFADSAMPSALPTPMGAVLGHAAQAGRQGQIAGAQQAQGYQQGQLNLEQGNLNIAQVLAKINFWRQGRGLPPLTADDLKKPGVSLDGGTQTPQAAGTPSPAAPTLPNVAASPLFGDPTQTIPAIRTQESGNDPNAVSPAGATGPMQLMPSTAGNPGFGVAPVKDGSTAENDRVGAQYFQSLVQRYGGNQTRALAAYNWGVGNTDKWIASGADPKKLPKSVQQYVGAIALGVPMSKIPQAAQEEATPASGVQPAATPDAKAFSPMPGIMEMGAADPDGALKLLQEWMKPQNLRAGGEATGLNLKTGQVDVARRNPNLSPNLEEDPNNPGGARLIPGAASGAAQLEGAETSAKEGAEFPYDVGRARATAAANAAGRMAADANQNALETGGNGLGQLGGGVRQPTAGPSLVPSATQPMRTQQGTILPPVSQAAPINPAENYLKERQPMWAKAEDDMYDALPSGMIAEQRALAIADALKATQSGAWAQEKADIAAKLKAVNIPVPESILGNPAAVQEALKNNFQSTLNQIRAFSSRPAAIEVQLASKNFANPDLQPEANLQIIGETVGTLRWERALANDWGAAKQQGWQDPEDFERAWMKANPIQGFIDQTTKQIGPLKTSGAQIHAPSGLPMPQIGEVDNGYRFKGGDPHAANSWEKVN